MEYGSIGVDGAAFNAIYDPVNSRLVGNAHGGQVFALLGEHLDALVNAFEARRAVIDLFYCRGRPRLRREPWDRQSSSAPGRWAAGTGRTTGLETLREERKALRRASATDERCGAYGMPNKTPAEWWDTSSSITFRRRGRGEHQLLLIRGCNFLIKAAKVLILLRFKNNEPASQRSGDGHLARSQHAPGDQNRMIGPGSFASCGAPSTARLAGRRNVT